MNFLPLEKVGRLNSLFDEGVGVRASAREVRCNRNTASRYYRFWVRLTLQRAYDLLWEGDCEGCDKLTAKVPAAQAKEMLDAWLDDQFDAEPISKWY